MLIIAYVPCGSEKEAEKISKVLVEEKLAACANIIESDSIFEWKKKPKRAKEWVILAKTVPEKFERLKARVERIHTYETPCILAIPVVDANDKYADWVRKQVK